MELRRAAREALGTPDPAAKAAAATALLQACRDGAALDPAAPLPALPDGPGRPARPRLVDPAQLPRRSPFTPEGRAALLHAVAHIEFNAIKIVFNECLHPSALLR